MRALVVERGLPPFWWVGTLLPRAARDSARLHCDAWKSQVGEAAQS